MGALLLALALAAPAAGSTDPPDPPGAEPVRGDRSSDRDQGGGGGKRAAQARIQRNYRTGQAIGGVGLVAGAVGLVVLGTGVSAEGTWTLDPARLHTSAGLLSVGGLVGSSGALGAALAVDNAAKRPAPVVAGALGLTLGIFAPTFFGVGLGLQMPAFAWAAIGTGAASTALTAVQMAQSAAHQPKRWRVGVDPGGRLVLVGAL